MAVIILVCFLASVIGSICGVGGGVIIKPVLDAFGIMSVSAISFLSSCTVLAMSCTNLYKNARSGNSQIRVRTTLPLAIGGAVGGVTGKVLFNMISAQFENANQIGAIQAAILALACVMILVYTLNRSRIRTYQVTNAAVCFIIGIFLGMISSFLGIGGGPIDLVVLYFFFSMSTKEAAQNSIFIIFFAQLANLIYTILSGTVPYFSMMFLVIMICAGISGGIAGSSINKKIDEKTVDKLFAGLVIVIIVINIYNIFKYIG